MVKDHSDSEKGNPQPVDMQEPYIALIDMGMIWRIFQPAEDRQM